jgi:hypothetical protein
MAKLQNRFSDQLLSIWDRHGIRPVGFWTTLLGESGNELTYILAWESLADRERKWTAFQEDPAWHKVRDESERDRPIVATPLRIVDGKVVTLERPGNGIAWDEDKIRKLETI